MDRDGTVCEEVGHLEAPDRLRLIEGSAEAIRLANEAGLQTVVATNQSGVARGLFGETEVLEVHDRLRELLGERGARLDGIYYCPQHPEEGNGRHRRDCDCRKPRPGMLWRARDQMGIDLSRSYLVGDRLRDLAAATAVGATPVLVLTGYGRRERETAVDGHAPAHVAENLLEAVRWILRREESAE